MGPRGPHRLPFQVPKDTVAATGIMAAMERQATGPGMSGFPVTIFHNRSCGTSRAVLAAIRAAGHAPMVVE